jgi:hypothetical protein
MRYYILTSIIFLFYNITWTQFDRPVRPYQQVKWPGVNPIWYKTSYIPEKDTDSSDGRNYIYPVVNLWPMINGDFIYTTYDIKNTTQDY